MGIVTDEADKELLVDFTRRGEEEGWCWMEGRPTLEEGALLGDGTISRDLKMSFHETTG